MEKSISAHISDGGRVVIPAELRKAYGLKIGDEVTFLADEKGIRVVPRNWAIKEMQTLVRKYIPKEKRDRMVDELIAQRRAEAKKEFE